MRPCLRNKTKKLNQHKSSNSFSKSVSNTGKLECLRFQKFMSAFSPVCCFCFFETWSPYVTQAGLKLSILLPQPLKCWNSRDEPPHPTHMFWYTLDWKKRLLTSAWGCFSKWLRWSDSFIPAFFAPLGPRHSRWQMTQSLWGWYDNGENSLYSHLFPRKPKEMWDLTEQRTWLEWLHMMFQDLRHNLSDKWHKPGENPAMSQVLITLGHRREEKNWNTLLNMCVSDWHVYTSGHVAMPTASQRILTDAVNRPNACGVLGSACLRNVQGGHIREVLAFKDRTQGGLWAADLCC
jgi:hypothetical protein